METYETEQYKGYTIKIVQDPDPMSPREWDNLGTMVCFHNHYDLGDKGHGYNSGDFEGWDDLRRHLEIEEGARIILPLALIDHSGISMYISSGAHPMDPGGWDSGQVGFYFVTAEQLRKEYSVKRITKAIEAKAEEVLRNEVKVYNDYLTGNVYGYIIEDPDGEQIDSCGGFVGEPDYCLDEAQGIVDGLTPAEDVLARTAELEQLIGGALGAIQAEAGITDNAEASEVTVKALRAAGLLTKTTEGTN